MVDLVDLVELAAELLDRVTASSWTGRASLIGAVSFLVVVGDGSVSESSSTSPPRAHADLDACRARRQLAGAQVAHAAGDERGVAGVADAHAAAVGGLRPASSATRSSGVAASAAVGRPGGR